MAFEERDEKRNGGESNIMRKGLFKNEIEKKEIDRRMLFESLSWKKPISSMTRLVERLTDANIDYAIEQDNKEKCFNVYIDSKDKLRAIDALEEE